MLVDIIKMSIRTIFTNKLRSGLSMLGIMIWVLTIMLVIAISKWSKKSIEEQYKNLAVTTVMVMPVNTEFAQSKLSINDMEPLLINPNITDVATLIQGKLPVSTTSITIQPTILGVNSDFFSISNLKVVKGTYFTNDDDKNREKKILLWYSVWQDLFGDDLWVVGEVITIARKKFEVLGILEPSGTTVWPITYDDSIFLPYTTADKIVLGADGTVRLIFLAKDIESIDLAMADATDILRMEHKLSTTDIDDFRLRDQGSRITTAQESANTMSVLLTSIAVIVLVVSGIGIMNVMFAGVAERTKEIGILKSIWAKSSHILLQFLVESILLTILWWFIGIILWEVFIPSLDGFEGMMLVRSFEGNIIAIFFAILVWVFFGIYPAYRASLLDPVDALRK